MSNTTTRLTVDFHDVQELTIETQKLNTSYCTSYRFQLPNGVTMTVHAFHSHEQILTFDENTKTNNQGAY